MLPKHMPPCLNLVILLVSLIQIRLKRLTTGTEMAQSRKRFRLSGPKRPVSVCSLPNEHDFDDVISKHTHFDVTIDLVTGKTRKELILALKQVV